jgi:hypothetical protein
MIATIAILCIKSARRRANRSPAILGETPYEHPGIETPTNVRRQAHVDIPGGATTVDGISDGARLAPISTVSMGAGDALRRDLEIHACPDPRAPSWSFEMAGDGAVLRGRTPQGTIERSDVLKWSQTGDMGEENLRNNP